MGLCHMQLLTFKRSIDLSEDIASGGFIKESLRKLRKYITSHWHYSVSPYRILRKTMIRQLRALVARPLMMWGDITSYNLPTRLFPCGLLFCKLGLQPSYLNKCCLFLMKHIWQILGQFGDVSILLLRCSLGTIECSSGESLPRV